MTERPLLQLVRNPGSGSHDPKEIGALVDALEAKGFLVELTISSAQTPFVPNLKASHVCVAGGDGTVRHVAAALAELNCPPRFSVYPMGTINLVAREWHAPKDPIAFALHVVERAKDRKLHVVGINETHFVACASIGPDSRAVAEVSESLKSKVGRLAYGVSLARVLLNWRPPLLKVTIDGKTHECGALYIANGLYYAGPWVVAPKASLNDRSLQVTMLRRAERIDFLRFLSAVLLNRASKLANVTIVEATSLTITSDRTVAVQLDGDEGTNLPATIAFSGTTLSG